MRSVLVAILICCSSLLFGQTFSLDFVETEKTVVAGYEAAFYGDLSVDTSSTYNFDLSISNVSLPAGWFYVICTPYNCLSPMIADVNFNFDPANPGSSDVQVKVQTNMNTIPATASLDVTLKDTLTNDSTTHTLILHVNTVDVAEHSLAREVVKITDYLGREVDKQKGVPFIVHYDDGTFEKRVVLD